MFRPGLNISLRIGSGMTFWGRPGLPVGTVVMAGTRETEALSLWSLSNKIKLMTADPPLQR
jgi:hypothetical protein